MQTDSQLERAPKMRAKSALTAKQLASDTATVNELNLRARADRVASGAVVEDGS